MIAKIIRYLFLAVIILVFLSLGLTQLPSVKQKIAESLVSYAEEKTGFRIRFKAIDLMLPFEIKTDDLEISKGGQLLAEAKQAIIRISPYSLLKKELHLHSIFIEDLTLYKENNPALVKNEEGISLSYPSENFFSDLPDIFLFIGQVKVDRLTLKNFFNNYEAPSIDLNGSVLYDPNEELARFNFKASYTDNPKRLIDLDVTAIKQEDLLMVGFNGFKNTGEFCTLPEGFSSKINGRFLGTLDHWTEVIKNPSRTDLYSLSGYLEQSLAYCVEGLNSPIEYELSSLIELGGTSFLRLIDFNVKSLLGSAHGNASLNQGFVIDFANLQFKLNLEKIIPLSKQEHLIEKIEGIAEGDLFLQGTLSKPYIKLRLKSSNPILFSENPEWVEGFLRGNITDTGFVGSLELALSRQGKNYSSTSDLFMDQKSISLQNLSLDLPFLQGVSQVSYDYNTKFIEASLKGKSNKLEILGDLVNRKLKGSAEFEIEYKKEEDLFLQADLKSPLMEFEGVLFKEAKALLFYDETKDSKGNIKLDAEKIEIENIPLRNVDLKIVQNKEVWDTEIRGLIEDSPLTLKGQIFSDDQKDYELYVDLIEGNLKGDSFKLLEPFSLKFSKSQMLLSPLFFSFGKATLFLSADYIEGFLHTSMRVDNLPLRFLPFKDYFDQTLEGHGSGHLSLYGDKNSMKGNLELELKNVIAIEDLDKKLPPLHAKVTAEIADNAVFAKAFINGVGKNPLTFEAELPFRFKLDERFFRIRKEQPFSCRIYADGPVTPILELFFVDVTALSGYGMIDALIDGTWNNPRFSGKAELSNGTFDHYVWGTALRNVKAEFLLEGTKIKLSKLSGTDGESGTLSGNGEFILDKDLNYQVNFELNKARLIKIDEADAIGSGQLVVNGSKNKTSINGTIALEKTTLSIPKKIPEVLDAVPIHYVNQNEDESPPTPARHDNLMEAPVDFHIDLKTEKPILILHDDLYSEWRGHALIEGKGEKPVVNGELKLIQGNYRLNGKDYELSQGRIHFGGNLDKKTTLSVLASKEIEDYKVEILVKGKLLNPDIILRASPPLSRQQILSLIIFGSFSSSVASSNSEDQIVQSLSKLSQANTSGGVLTKIQKNLGIDHIEFLHNNTADGSVRLRVGKYITPNICLYLDRGINDDMNRVALEAKLRKNIRAELEAQDNGEGQVSLFWRKSY
ncbi:translocation/assembly module TamB domain-containing protein [Criblamydia sequanensis]|uniref:Conserved putative secreted protein n=1 Tax=Candidatus Criblamydia sequanensis CRIB-18 TaxID=1437425 RepID=A0A090D363_9BACT|nr:translocation/assembly module TamB domain-containing protein [Criblamydia sequanensis]CDR34978.1 Conserved putative secreted protein [Criblamydia sequanensis CRIB-18]